jgi:hypothetical protein
MGAPYFDFYDSFNKPIAHGQTANVQKFEPEYMKHLRKGFFRGRLSLVRWFFFKNFYNLVVRLSLVVVLAVAGIYLVQGGMGDVTSTITDTLNEVMSVNKTSDMPTPTGEVAPNDNMDMAKSNNEMAAIELVRQTYEEELRRALLENEALKNDLTVTKKNLGDMSSIVLFTPETIVTMRGNEYGVGEEIDYGEHAGKRIVEINFRQRKAILDDGTLLFISDERLRKRQEQAKPDDTAKRPDVQAVLPSS